MAAAGRELQCDAVFCCQQRILDRDQPRVGEYVHVPATAGRMVSAGSDRLYRGFSVDNDDVRPCLLCLPGKAGDLCGRYMRYLHAAEQPHTKQPGGLLHEL